MTEPRIPAIRDAVVVDGVKYRIRSIEEGVAHCRASFRGDPSADFDQRVVDLDDLRWDRIAGVWRAMP